MQYRITVRPPMSDPRGDHQFEIRSMEASQLCLGHKVPHDFRECVYTEHDERHTRFIDLQDFNVDQSAWSQLNFGPPGTIGSL